MGHVNELGQPVGYPVPNWQPPPHPSRQTLEGRFCRLEPLAPGRHAEALFRANALDTDGRGWTYLPYGPFADFAAYAEWMRATCLGDDPLFYAIIDLASGQPVGVANGAPSRRGWR